MPHIIRLESFRDAKTAVKVLHKLVQIVLLPPVVRHETIRNVLLPSVVRRELICNVLLLPIVRLESVQADTLAAGGPFALFCLAN